MSEEKKRLRSAGNSSLPLISVLDDRKTMNRAKKLLLDAIELKTTIDTAQAKLESIKEELGVFAQGADLKGFRWGLAGFECHGYKSRSTLRIEKLVEAGVSPETIAQCTVPGAEYLDVKIIRFDIE